MVYERYKLSQDLVIEEIITFHYKELTRDFNHKGERHDFWELVYVDKGEVEIVTDNNQYVLKQGDCVFYKPNEFHRGNSHLNIAPSLIVICFICTSPHMAFFGEKSFYFEDRERMLLTDVLQEGADAFSSSANSPHMDRPKCREDEELQEMD